MRAATAAPAREGPSTERRQVSVLFADIVGFTAFAEGRDPERVRALQSRYFELASEMVQRHGGTVEKFIGDAVMAVWGTPVAHEDDAQRAVRAGLEVVDAVEALGAGLQARAGIVTGEAAVTLGARNQGMVAGDMVNTASRLQSSADGAQVLADARTVQVASNAIVFEPVDDRELKGKADPMPAWRAVRVQAGRVAPDALVEPPFVGRAEELRRVKELLHAAGRDRRIRLVSITGPAGIGKSRLIEELGNYADGLAEDIWWHTGRSPSYGEGLAFWALGEMVRRRAGLAETDGAKITAERIAATVEEFVADPDERGWINDALLALLGTSQKAEGETLFPAWRTFIERIAERGTTVLVFEDLQWADTGTLDFIEHVLDWSRAQPIVIITLARPELLDTRPGWGTARSNSSSMAIEPLDDGAMRDLLNGVVPGLPSGQADAIVGRAEGMPLYAVEIVRALVAEGRLQRVGEVFEPVGGLDAIAIPASLRSLIASRLDALEPDERTLLQHASVLGQVFSAEALASVAGMDTPELEPRLRALVRREMLQIEADPKSPERGQYRFVQSLIREVAYETLAMRDRRTRHLAAARHLESSEADEVAGALASHYLAAYHASDEGPEADAVAVQARISLRAAAERAASLGAHEQAVRNLEHALTITPDPAERAQLLERAAVSAGVAVMPGAPAFARQAVDAYDSIGDRQGALRATWTFGDVLLDAGDVAAADDVLSKAIAGLTDADSGSEGAAMVYAMQARAKMRLDDASGAVEAADRAIQLGERLDLPLVIAAAVINKGSAYSNVGRRTEAEALIRAGIELAEAGDWAHLELRARGNLGTTLSGTDPRDALEMHERTLEIARRIGDRMTFQFTAVLRADLLTVTGEGPAWAEADRLLDEAELLASPGIDLAYIVNVRAMRDSLRGRDVGDLLARIDAEVAETTDPRAELLPLFARAVTSWTSSRWTDAIEYSRKAIATDPYAVFNLGGFPGNAALRARDRVAAEAMWTVARDHPETSNWSIAARRHLEAVVAVLDGRVDEAIAHFAEALERYTRIGAGLEASITALTALVAAPEEPRVRRWADDARARLIEIDAVSVVAMIDDLLGRDPTVGQLTPSPDDVPIGSA